MDWLKYKKYYLLFSLGLVFVSVFSILRWGFRLGVDFQGGTLIEYVTTQEIVTDDAIETLKQQAIDVRSVQKSENAYLIKLQYISQEEKEKVVASIENDVFGSQGEVVRFETVGPSIGPELIKKTGYAIAIAAVLILLWVAYQFKSFTFGASAIIAMFHDSFILVGMFSLLGYLWRAEVDFLFVTALLTTLSFSVHDTIVVFDRIRELKHKFGGDLEELSNKALTETMVRSINNSFTIIFMLLALLLLGGTTIKWFAAALLIGTVLGTYSSPFIAVPLLIYLNSIKKSN